MAHLQYSTYENREKYDEYAKQELWYSQAVRIGDIIDVAGQGGWNRNPIDVSKSCIDTNTKDQCRSAFSNVSSALKAAGSKGWTDVFSVKAYFGGVKDGNEEALQVLGECMREWCPEHQPISTVMWVQELAFEGMKVEIEVRAHLSLDSR